MDGRITVIGGCNAGAATAAVQSYEFFSSVWTSNNDLPAARYGFATGAIDGAIYVAGGADSSDASVDTFEKFESGIWSALPPLPRARQFPAGAVLDGKLYVIGGTTSSGTLSFTDVDIYDPATNEWTSGRPMPTGRATGAVALDGVIFVVSGTEAGLPVTTVQIYDPYYDIWSGAPSIPTARVSAQPVVIGSSIYVAGNVAPGEAAPNAFEALVLEDGGGAIGNNSGNPSWNGTWNGGGGPGPGGPQNNDSGGNCNCSLALASEGASPGWLVSIAVFAAAIAMRRRR
jgi:MYXO-CTERM domain-containing protein